MLGSSSLVTGLIIALIFLAIAVAYLSKKCDRLQAKAEKYEDWNKMLAIRETEFMKLYCEEVISEKINGCNKISE